MSTALHIEIVYALPALQVMRRLTLEPGATAGAAVRASHLADEFPDIRDGITPLACFGQRIGWDAILKNGDRVEILRPLLADPKDTRRHRARAQAAGKKLR